MTSRSECVKHPLLNYVVICTVYYLVGEKKNTVKNLLVGYQYCKTPNKPPWAFVSFIALNEEFLLLSTFLQNEKQERGIGAWLWGRGIQWKGTFMGLYGHFY